MLPVESFPLERQEDRREKLLVLKHLLCRPHITRVALGVLLKIQYFYAYPDLACLLAVIQEYWREHKAPPSMDVLIMELSAIFEQAGVPNARILVAAYREVVRAWVVETSWSDAYVQSIITEAIRLREIALMRLQVTDNDDLDDVRKIVQRAERAVSTDLFTQLEEETAWDDIEGSMQESARLPLGIRFFDKATDGGLAVGEAMLVIAPSGGGKTTLGIQVGCKQVDRQIHCVYLSTEQPQKGDLSIRQYIIGAKAKRADFKDGYANLSPEIRARLDDAKVRWKTYFHFVDCRHTTEDGSRNIRSVEDLFQPIDRLLEQGKHCDLVILDWWGRLRSRLIMQETKLSDARMRHATSDWLAQLICGIKDRQSRLVVFHQVAGAAAKKGPKARITSHDAQEDSNLNNLFEFAFALSKLNSDNVCAAEADKARSTGRTRGNLQLVGEECLFRTMDPQEMQAMESTGNTRAMPLDSYTHTRTATHAE